MIAIGLMSGTSADGIDAAAVELSADVPPRARLLIHRRSEYDGELRALILAVAGGAPHDARALALLHRRLGDAHADLSRGLIGDLGRRPDVIAMHGQTIAHFPKEGVTLQLGDAARVAIRTDVPTIADFRSADIAAGGEGAPLVPFADHLLFADQAPVAILNLGGIANLTLIPSRDASTVRGFDTGPGNMAIDRIARENGTPLDRDGAGARRGRVDERALEAALAEPYFQRTGPRSTGREEFGDAFAKRILAGVRAAGGSLEDALATATEITAVSIGAALQRETPAGGRWSEIVVAGGGARNAFLCQRVSARTGLSLRRSDELGIPAEAREAMAFAILGAYRLRGQPNTLPSCTGARRAVSAGAIHRP